MRVGARARSGSVGLPLTQRAHALLGLAEAPALIELLVAVGVLGDRPEGQRHTPAMGVVEASEPTGMDLLLRWWLSSDGGGVRLRTLGPLLFGVTRPDLVLFTLAKVGRLRPIAQRGLALAGSLVKVGKRAARRAAATHFAHGPAPKARREAS